MTILCFRLSVDDLYIFLAMYFLMSLGSVYLLTFGENDDLVLNK